MNPPFVPPMNWTSLARRRFHEREVAVARFDESRRPALRRSGQFRLRPRWARQFFSSGFTVRYSDVIKRQQPVVFDEIAIFIDDENFFRSCVDQETDVVAERCDDMRELLDRSVEFRFIARQFFRVEIGVEREQPGIGASRECSEKLSTRCRWNNR